MDDILKAANEIVKEAEEKTKTLTLSDDRYKTVYYTYNGDRYFMRK